MSVQGHSRRFDRVQLTSGLTPQADIITDRRHVSKVPEAADQNGRLDEIRDQDGFDALAFGSL